MSSLNIRVTLMPFQTGQSSGRVIKTIQISTSFIVREKELNK